MRGVRLHAWIFAAGALGLVGANALTDGDYWWSIWPILVWGMALGAHYSVRKARSVDESWAEERAADVHSKSYDAGHMDDIAKRYDPGKPGQPDKPD
jgi:hypothetical protein